MKVLNDHIVEGDSVNHQLTVTATDQPGHGGANHEYEIGWARDDMQDPSGITQIRYAHTVSFQNGPIKEAGVNGVTHEALLAILIDRLRSFQSGPFKCVENELALQKCEDALWQLQERTKARIARAVEGTHQK